MSLGYKEKKSVPLTLKDIHNLSTESNKVYFRRDYMAYWGGHTRLWPTSFLSTFIGKIYFCFGQIAASQVSYFVNYPCSSSIIIVCSLDHTLNQLTFQLEIYLTGHLTIPISMFTLFPYTFILINLYWIIFHSYFHTNTYNLFSIQ